MIFRRKKKAPKDIFEKGNFNIGEVDLTKSSDILVSLIYANDAVNTVYPACASCYGVSEEKNQERQERIEYIGRRVKTQHTSILEHSNVIIQAFIPLKDMKDELSEVVYKYNKNIKPELTDINTSNQSIIEMVSEVKDSCRYLTTHSEIIGSGSKDSPILKITFGGSIRGYRFIFETIENRNNALFISIFNVLKLAIPSSFFIDFINDGVMENYETIEITKDLHKNCPQKLLNKNISNDNKIDIINADDLAIISDLTKIDREKCFDFVSMTTDFKNMSRIITQQLTRHRNGITQESQRYVNYSGAMFNTPDMFKDKYDSDKIYKTAIGEYNMADLGNIMSSVYKDLVDQGMDKEDARGYLPENIQSGKVFMTFTLRTLFSFLNLRLDPHAQAEIRMYAENMADITAFYARQLKFDDMYLASSLYTLPIYKLDEVNNNEYNNIDEEV